MSARLFFHVISVEARRRMSYRVDFWLTALVSFATQLGVVYFVWTSLFAESGKTTMGGYTLDGMLLYYVAVLLVGKLVRGVEFDNHVSQDIYEGGLNRYLVFPTSYFLFKYAQNLGALLPALMQLALFGVWFLFVLDLPPDVQLTPLTVAMGLVSVAVANLLYFVMLFPLRCVAFWADNVWSLVVALRFTSGILGGFLIPLSVFPEWSRAILAWLPFRFLFDFPVNVTLGKIPAGEWALGLGLALAWAGVMALIGRVVWRRGELQYSGIGI